MTLGFGEPTRQASFAQEIVGWELYQVQVDKYHVMFWFEGGCCLLNAAWRFAFISADGLTAYVYDIQAEGGRKAFDLDRVLQLKVARIDFPDAWEMHLIFSNGDCLVVFDQPHMRSVWALRWNAAPSIPKGEIATWSVNDDEPEDVGRVSYIQHRIPERP